MCTIYHSLFNVERAVAIKSNSMFNLTDLMTISLPKADRKNLCWRFETITSVWCLNVKKCLFMAAVRSQKNHHGECIIYSFGWFVDLFLFYATASVFQSHNDGQLNLTTLFLDPRPPYDQRKLCDRAEVQTRVSAVRGAADCASDHSS